jgi:hypothetical protein
VVLSGPGTEFISTIGTLVPSSSDSTLYKARFIRDDLELFEPEKIQELSAPS